ncbi:MAG: fumarate hydratase C-terminal domain-containing protein [Lentisphaerae bacterium]|nr:fumarate hydratase C-terminal domain-containing protein [Lentisphaerota bacterium]
MSEVSIEYPFSAAAVRNLSVGDRIRLSGLVFTGRDRFHKYLFDGGKSPVHLKDGAIYHCGPVVIRKDGEWKVLAAGPTTSSREDLYTPKIIEEHKIRVIIGKGGMGKATLEACSHHGCVYLQAVGGAAAHIAQRVERVQGVHLIKEFGAADAVWELIIHDMEAVVTMDAHGNSLHKRIRNSSKRSLRVVIAGD